MDIVKIAAIGLISCILCVYISKHNSDYTIYISVTASLLILSLCIQYIAPVVRLINALSENSGINNEHIKTVIKIIATAYIAQFASDACLDCKQQAIASKIDMASRFVILYLCIPLLLSLFEYITTLL